MAQTAQMPSARSRQHPRLAGTVAAGFSNMYIPGGASVVLCSIFGCDYPANAVLLPAGQHTFNLAGLGLTNIRLVGIYGHDFHINEIETVPEPLAALLTALGLGAVAVRQKSRNR